MIRAAKIAFFSSVFVLAACQSQSANQAGEASSERAERGEITLASFNEDGSLRVGFETHADRANRRIMSMAAAA